jgi:hypothetical protein
MRAPHPTAPDPADSTAANAAGAARLTTPICADCSAAVTGCYYEANGAIVCALCRAGLDHPRGARLRRASAAVGLGVVGATAGSLLYFGVLARTGFEFGFVGVVVGFLVGAGVRRGSRGRGGWAYQILAAVLTYLAIVSTYVPGIAKEARNATMRDALHMSGNAGTAPIERELVVRQAGTTSERPARPLRTTQRLGFGTMLLGGGALIFLAAIDPILGGVSNIMGLVIIGIALFVASMLNRRSALEITGPYDVAVTSADVRAVA